MSTAVAMIVVLVSRLLLAAVPGEGREASALATISGVILLVAVATGFLCLILTPLVYRARISPPPRPITIFAILIGLAPLVALAVLAL